MVVIYFMGIFLHRSSGDTVLKGEGYCPRQVGIPCAASAYCSRGGFILFSHCSLVLVVLLNIARRTCADEYVMEAYCTPNVSVEREVIGIRRDTLK